MAQLAIPTLSMYVGTIERLEHEVRALKSRVDKHNGGTFFTMHVHFFCQEVYTYVCAFDVGLGCMQVTNFPCSHHDHCKSGLGFRFQTVLALICSQCAVVLQC